MGLVSRELQLWCKPLTMPVPATISLIWTSIVVASFGFVSVQAFRRKLSVALPFAVYPTTNLIFTPIQIEIRNLPLASLDIFVVWATIHSMMAAV